MGKLPGRPQGSPLLYYTRLRCPLLTETVVRSLARSDFTAEQIMTDMKPVTVYLRWKEQDLLALSPLVRLLWGSLISELVAIYDSRAGSGCQPVLLLIDEAGRTAIPSLADHATTVVGRGISIWLAVQSLSQLEVVYGKARAQVATGQYGEPALLPSDRRSHCPLC